MAPFFISDPESSPKPKIYVLGEIESFGCSSAFFYFETAVLTRICFLSEIFVQSYFYVFLQIPVKELVVVKMIYAVLKQ